MARGAVEADPVEPAAGEPAATTVGRWWWLLPVVILLASFLVAGFLLTRPEPGSVRLVDCAATQPEDYRCWSDRLRYLAENDSPGAALEDARLAAETNGFVAAQCHQFAHEIGRSAGHRYDSIAEAYQHGDPFCASGYFHGVMEAFADIHGEDHVMSRAGEVCAEVKAERPYAINHYNCSHGLGHGLMGVVQGELFAALDGCEGMADDWERQACYSGVFMENIMSRIMEYGHHDTAYLREEEPLYPCTAVADHYKGQCYIIQTGYVLNVFDYDFDRAFDLCADAELGYVPTCMQSMGRDISGYTLRDKARTMELCELADTAGDLENCLVGAAKDYVYHYSDAAEAVAMCRTAEDALIAAVCAREAEAYFATL
jgi:hypothetical protein